jgi:hypothetical protein
VAAEETGNLTEYQILRRDEDGGWHPVAVERARSKQAAWRAYARTLPGTDGEDWESGTYKAVAVSHWIGGETIKAERIVVPSFEPYVDDEKEEAGSATEEEDPAQGRARD